MTAVMLISVMLVVTVGVLAYASEERRHAISLARGIPRNFCSETGLQLARAYFGNNFVQWNTYLAAPAIYNPVPSCAGGPSIATPAALAALKVAHPELFADLDGDGNFDVYIYIRDNSDEFAPAAANCARDNDMQVIVGAACISQTLVPRMQNGQTDPTFMTTEGTLIYNPQDANTNPCGSTGTCNAN